MPLTTPKEVDGRSGLVDDWPVAANTVIHAGANTAIDDLGNLHPASDTVGLKVVGRAEESADNATGAAGDAQCRVRRGTFLFNNLPGDPVEKDALLTRAVYVVDDETVSAGDGLNLIRAGRVMAITDEGVFVDTTEAND